MKIFFVQNKNCTRIMQKNIKFFFEFFNKFKIIIIIFFPKS